MALFPELSLVILCAMEELRFIHRRFDALSLRELHDILWLRNEVFVFGQKITAEPEVDGLDPECTHILGLTASGRVVATARYFSALNPVKVGRVAVHQDMQRGGVGTLMMQYLIDVMGHYTLEVSAQLYLKEWYAGLGWIPDGDVYDEAEIPHIHMVRPPTNR